MKKMSFLLAVVFFLTVASPSAKAIDQMKYNSLQSRYAKQYVIETGIEGIVQDINQNYAMVITKSEGGPQTFIPVGKQDIVLTSQESLNMLEYLEGVEDETKETIIRLAQERQMNTECDCDECNTVSIFSPGLLPTSQANAPSITYEEYNGHRMKIEIVSGDSHVGYETIAYGMSFENTAAEIVSIGIDLTLEALDMSKLTLFAGAVSLLDAILEDASANTVYGTSSDEAQVKLRYDYTVKHTYAERTPNAGDWAVGCVSQSATITQALYTYDVYVDNERKACGDFNIFMDASIYSEHYLGEDNLETAWLNINHPHSDNGITVYIEATTFELI